MGTKNSDEKGNQLKHFYKNNRVKIIITIAFFVYISIFLYISGSEEITLVQYLLTLLLIFGIFNEFLFFYILIKKSQDKKYFIIFITVIWGICAVLTFFIFLELIGVISNL